MMNDKKLDVEERFQKLNERVNRLRPVPAQALNPAAMVLDSIRAGEPVVCNKAFHAFEGSGYQPGEPVDVERIGAGQCARLAQYGYLIPGKMWNEYLGYQEAVDVLGKVQPIRDTLAQAQRDAADKTQMVALKMGELKAAERIAGDAAGQVQFWQDTLNDALNGDDVSAILNG